jgi:hypothetical protein
MRVTYCTIANNSTFLTSFTAVEQCHCDALIYRQRKSEQADTVKIIRITEEVVLNSDCHSQSVEAREKGRETKILNYFTVIHRVYLFRSFSRYLHGLRSKSVFLIVISPRII